MPSGSVKAPPRGLKRFFALFVGLIGECPIAAHAVSPVLENCRLPIARARQASPLIRIYCYNRAQFYMLFNGGIVELLDSGFVFLGELDQLLSGFGNFRKKPVRYRLELIFIDVVSRYSTPTPDTRPGLVQQYRRGGRGAQVHPPWKEIHRREVLQV